MSQPGRSKDPYRSAPQEGSPVHCAPRHLVLLTEADAEVGLGHAVRCAGLLHAIGPADTLSVIGRGQALQQVFSQATHFDLGSGWDAFDWNDFPLADIEMVLVDLPPQRARDWHRLRRANTPLVAIDDFGGSVAADVVVNGTVLAAYHHYADLPPRGRVCAGARFSLVRPEFAAAPWTAPLAGGVVCVVGSGKAACTWALALAEAGPSRFGAPHACIVVGAAFSAIPDLRALCIRTGFALCVGLPASALARLFADAGVVLATAGMVLYEAVATGVPIVAFAQLPDMVPEAEWFAAHGACIDIGADGGGIAQACAAVNALLRDPARGRAMSACQRALLDGRGIERVARVLNDLLQTPP